MKWEEDLMRNIREENTGVEQHLQAATLSAVPDRR